MSLDRARAQQKGSPKQCPGVSNVFLLVFVKDKKQALMGCIQMAKCFRLGCVLITQQNLRKFLSDKNEWKNIFAFENM